MADNDNVSVDEYLAKRKGFVTEKGQVLKGVIQTDDKGAAPVSFDKASRTVRMTMTTEQEDRDKDIVMQAGLDLKEFLKNPAAPFAHRSYDFPVGAWKDVTPVLTGRPKRHEGTLVLTAGDENADRLMIHLAAGSVRACSIGFMPKEIKRREKPQNADGYVYTGYEILSAELWECSPCLIPANPGALAKSAEAHGILPAEFIGEILDTWKAIDGWLVPRQAFEEERAKHAAGKSFSFSGRTFKAGEHGATILVPVEAEKSEDSGLVRRLAKLFGLGSDASKDPVNLEALLASKSAPESPAAPETKAEPETPAEPELTPEAKALKDAQDAEELENDIREKEARFALMSSKMAGSLAA